MTIYSEDEASVEKLTLFFLLIFKQFFYQYSSALGFVSSLLSVDYKIRTIER